MMVQITKGGFMKRSIVLMSLMACSLYAQSGHNQQLYNEIKAALKQKLASIAPATDDNLYVGECFLMRGGPEGAQGYKKAHQTDQEHIEPGSLCMIKDNGSEGNKGFFLKYLGVDEQGVGRIYILNVSNDLQGKDIESFLIDFAEGFAKKTGASLLEVVNAASPFSGPIMNNQNFWIKKGFVAENKDNSVNYFKALTDVKAEWIINDENKIPHVSGSASTGTMQRGKCYDLVINEVTHGKQPKSYRLTVNPSRTKCASPDYVAWIYLVQNNTSTPLEVEYYDNTKTSNNRTFTVAPNSVADLGMAGKKREGALSSFVAEVTTPGKAQDGLYGALIPWGEGYNGKIVIRTK